MSRMKSAISEFIKYHRSKGGSYDQYSDVSELPDLSKNMTQVLLGSGLCSSVDTKRRGFVLPFWSSTGRVENRDLGMLFDISHSKIVVDGFKSSKLKSSNFKNVNCYATTIAWCGYSASPVFITTQTSQSDYHPSTESINALALKNLMELAIQSYVMQVAYNSRSSWNNAWSKTPDETMRGRFVLSLNRTTNETSNQKIVLNTDLKNVLDNDRITKNILSVSLTSLRYDAMDDMRQLALEIITPLQDAGYEVNITTHEGNAVIDEQGYAQVLEISIDVTDDIAISSQNSISECRFLRTLESVLRKTTPSTRKPLYLLDEQRELTALERIASDNNRISQEYHKQVMSLAEKTIHASTNHQDK